MMLSKSRIILFVLLAVALTCANANEEEIEPAHAVLFPIFSLTIGVLVFYLLTRYARTLPYTAVMFFIGTIMGIGSSFLDSNNQLNESIRLWSAIDSEVMLLIFLPGLIFKDAKDQSVHLFRIALPQLFLFAFPMVLAGTALTACVAYYIFPFGWSFNLAMTFGSILSATDPVAVAALLNEVGAPPRLKTHIAGESLLNDGSAIVFFSIFAARYLYELNIPGLGEDVDFGRGVALFFQKAGGGAVIGFLFGAALLVIIFMLKRRLNREENVVEVTATIAVAYVGYYVAEVVCETSGVISTVVTGLTVKFFGVSAINDANLLDDFWTLVEHLLNTVLFVLGGTVWGGVIATGEKDGTFEATDWGYLVLLYVLLHVIRALLFAAFYPLISRIGLKTCWRETVFQVYGGLRGAVGIALAIAIDNEVKRATRGNDQTDESLKFEEETTKLFALVGGIAFMTLTINGITAGPFLRKLGLSDSTETREKIVRAYQINFRASAIDDFVSLLTQPRFHDVNFALVKHHVPFLADLTKKQLIEAVERHKDTTAAEDYQPPHLVRILPYLKDDEKEYPAATGRSAVKFDVDASTFDAVDYARKIEHDLRKKNRHQRRNSSTLHFILEGEPLSAQELRTLFLSILRAAYAKQVREGELETRKFLSIALESSLDFAEDAVANGETLKDWEFLTMIDKPFQKIIKDSVVVSCLLDKAWVKKAHASAKFAAKRLEIERSLAFMAAHKFAQKFFYREFQNGGSELSEAGKVIMEESRKQYEKAETVLKKSDRKEVELASSHKFCTVILNHGISYVGRLVRSGLLKESEAEHWVESIEHDLHAVLTCEEHHHPGEVTIDDDEKDHRKSEGFVLEEEEIGDGEGSNNFNA
jgi:NhaP-type Na+/H+ or K+/H+ antiporter